MTKATELLAADHQEVLKQLRKLEAGLDDLDIDAGSRNDIVVVADFIGEEVKRHFLYEEEILFPLMEKIPGMKEGPLKMMNLEHEEFKNNNEKFQELADRLRNKEDPNSYRSALESIGRAMILLLREHIDKEDNVLFPMAERFLGTEVLLTAAEKMRISKKPLDVNGNVKVLDIRELNEEERGSLVITTFDEIVVGEEVKVISDKDSKNIHEVFEQDRQGRYVWHYEESGPGTWITLIKKVA